MNTNAGFARRITKSVILASSLLIVAVPAMGEPYLQSISQSLGGGRGLLYMQSARTYGRAALVIGGKVLYERRDYPVSWKDTDATNNATVLNVPVTLGLTDYLDITGSFNVFNDVRPYRANLRFGETEYGFGASSVGLKLRYPFPMDNPVQVAIRLGAILDTSKIQADALNYRWIRKGTDYDVSLLQTFDAGEKFSFHFEEGYTVSGSTIFDDQFVGAAGIEMRANDRWTFGLEVNNRTFDGVGPRSVFQAGNYFSEYQGGATNVGNQKFLLDDEADWGTDTFVLVPSVSYRLSDKWAIDAGAVVNMVEQYDPKEMLQLAVGISYGVVLPWSADSDKDGVNDKNDNEPATPAGYPVDARGVSLDSDGDGVPDGADQEKNTPRGVKVNTRGVGIDSDGDGVLDGLDKEIATPKGYAVDASGVALDTDKDGVPDGRDKERNTPAGYPVDSNGIVLDTDGDRVPDGKDLEKDTARGLPVDEFGRAIKEQERALVQEGMIRLNAVYFDTGKDTIKAESFAALNEAADILRKYPALKIEIQGHTDSVGDIVKNRQLSEGRARAVLEYMLKRDPSLNRDNFKAVGYGSYMPVGDNATVEGRKANRRVDFVVLNKEALQK